MAAKSPLRAARDTFPFTLSDATTEPERHVVHFYEDDTSLCKLVTEFVADGLIAGEAAVVLAAEAHLRVLRQQLTALRIDCDGAEAAGQLTLLDAHGLLARIMVDGAPCPARFSRSVGALVEERAGRAGASRLRIYGELVDVLWQQGQATAALRLEELWNDLQASQPFTLLCAYVMANFYREPADIRRVCALHSHIHHGHLRSVDGTPASTPPESGLGDREAPLPFAAELAQRAEVEAALKAALRDAHRKEERLQMALRAGTMGIWEWDLPSNRVSWSPTIEAIHGIPEGSFPGTLEAYQADIHPDDRERVLENLHRIRGGGSEYSTQYRIVRPTGDVRWLEAHGYVERDAQGAPARVVGVCRDITDRKRHEAEREAASRRNARLAAVTTAVASAVTAEEVFLAVVDQLGAILGASTGALWLQEGDDHASLVYSTGYREEAKASLSGPLDSPRGLPAFDVIRTGQPMWLASPGELIAAYPHLEPFVSPGRGYRIACLPLGTRAETIGALGFTFEDGRAFEEDERSFLTLAAGYCAQALERLRLLEAERASRARAEAARARMALLDRASRAFSEVGPDLSSLFRTIVREVNDGYAEACGIVLLADSGDELVVAAVEHRDPEGTAAARALLEASPLKIGQGVSGRVAATGRAALVPHLDPALFDASEYTSYRPFLEHHLPASLVAVPLRARGRVLGTLTATRTKYTPPFEEQDLQLLQELSDRAALAIESSRLHLANEQARGRAELLYRLAAGLIGAEGLEQLFQTALDGLESALGAERSSILAYGEDDVMRFKAWRGLSDEYRQAVEGHSPWARDVRNPAPIVVGDIEQDEELAPLLPLFRREGIRGLAFIPLVADGRLIGKFMVYYRQPRSIGAQELELAGAIANHVAAAIVRFATIGQLERTVHLNEMFTGMLGHDLRNPLGAIMTAAQLALMRDEGTQLARPLGRILRAGSRMARMIDQLLDFTRVRVGNGIPLTPRQVDLVPLVRQVIDELDEARPEVPLRLHHTGDTQGYWDADRLSQVFSNLVANAAQHGVPDHGCTVHVDGTTPDRLQIDVHNRGVVPAEVLPHMFEPMTGQTLREGSRGLGLGLFITQQILKAHGGSIRVRSDEETGTTFTLELPRALPRLLPELPRPGLPG